MIVNAPDKFTAREYEEIKISQEEAEKNRQFQLQLAKAENSWNLLFRIPLALIALPVRLVSGDSSLCDLRTREGTKPGLLASSKVLGSSRQLLPQLLIACSLWMLSQFICFTLIHLSISVLFHPDFSSRVLSIYLTISPTNT
jgi:hypothetical protein